MMQCKIARTALGFKMPQNGGAKHIAPLNASVAVQKSVSFLPRARHTDF